MGKSSLWASAGRGKMKGRNRRREGRKERGMEGEERGRGEERKAMREEGRKGKEGRVRREKSPGL